jgi:hypothetical protein
MSIRTLFLLSLLAAPVQASVTTLTISPPQVSLNSSRSQQLFVVQATYADGITSDVTAKAKVALVNPALAKIAGNMLTPAADGETQLVVEFEGKKAQVPVKVTDATKDRPISFKLDVMPIFMRAGCNSGGCHGAARGKDGFRLSLFGFDPDGDHHRLTREAPGRRLNLALPGESLLIEKACGKVPHTGGQRIKEGDYLYKDLVRWMEAKAPNDPATIPTPVDLEIYPPNAVLDGKGETQQMTVRAKYSDGSFRDVTHLALFLSNNDNSAKISENGLVTANERGEAFVMARFATFTVGSQVIVLPKGLKYTWPKVEEKNYIDTLVHAKLQKLRILPTDICDDETFLRRVYIDIIGILPTVEEYNRFVSSKDPAKREKLVDELLNRKEFAELWVLNGRNSSRSAAATRSATRPCCSITSGSKTRSRTTCRSTSGCRNSSVPRAARSRIPRPTSTSPSVISSRSPKTSHKCSWACVSSVPSVTTTRSTGGPWTTITASPPSSARSAGRAPTTRARWWFSTAGAARFRTQSPGRS